MACTCQYGGFCVNHPKCPWCGNYTTVFASGVKEFRCTRCKRVFDKKFANSKMTAQTVKEIPTMAKKNIVAAKASKKSAKKASRSVERTSSLEYKFLRMPEDAPGEETLMGTVLAGIKKIKSGSLDEAVEAAIKAGLKDVSDQDPLEKTRIMLRRLANDGAVRITRHGEEVAGRVNGTSKKASKKKASKKTNGKSFKLVSKK